MSRSRAWIYVWNNYTPEHETKLQGITSIYHIYGREKGDSGTPHLQGYIYFKCAKTFETMQKMFAGAHVERAKGSPQHNRTYAAKGEQPKLEWEEFRTDGPNYGRHADIYESGTLPSQGKRTDIDKCKDFIDSGASMREIANEFPALIVRYSTGISKLRSLLRAPPEPIDGFDFHWYYGDTGTGKSLAARTENPDAYIKNKNKWWCGYDHEDVVIIEEWTPDYKMLADYLLQWCDHYPFQAEVKGSSMLIRPKRIVITSNYTIEDCFEDSKSLPPLLRRFKIKHFSKLS